MQKYLSPAKRYMSRVMPHPANFKEFVQHRRVLVYGITALIVLVTLLSFVVIKGRMNTNNDAFTHETHVNGNSVTTNVTNDGTTPIANGPNISSSTSDGKTSVIVNDQAINVPQNGSISKTITNGDGSTTHIDVTHNSTQSGDSASSSTSTSTNISTNTYSNSVNLHSP